MTFILNTSVLNKSINFLKKRKNGRPAELAPYRWWAEDEQRGCQTTAVEEAGACGVGGHSWASGLSGLPSEIRAHSWLDSGTESLSLLDWETGAHSGLDVGTGDEGGLDGASGDEGERRGGKSASRSVSQSMRSPSKSSSPRCTISSPSVAVQGAELHSALSPSTACSLAAGTVAGSRTWSDGLGSFSGAILRSVARYCTGSLNAVGIGSPSSVGSGFSSTQRINLYQARMGPNSNTKTPETHNLDAQTSSNCFEKKRRCYTMENMPPSQLFWDL